MIYARLSVITNGILGFKVFSLRDEYLYILAITILSLVSLSLKKWIGHRVGHS